MSITFPSNPSHNQTHTHNDAVWVYNGTAWDLQSTGGGASVTISNSAPTSPTEGSLWLNDNTGDIGVYFGGSWAAITGTGPAGAAGTAGSQGATGATGPAGAAAPSGGGYDMAANSTGYFALPIGTTAQRPATAANGYMRFNTTIGRVEYWETVANVWVTVERSAAQPTITSLGQLDVQYLVIAGGGGGGNCMGGGGGAGGHRFSNVGVTLTTNTNYTVTVGSGGAGATSRSSSGSPGNASSAIGISTTGGGGAASWTAGGLAGGSGGGGCQGNTNGSGNPGQGYAGGTSPAGISGAGGGGAGAAGSNGAAGAGGLGVLNGFSESTLGELYASQYWVAGGGGAGNGGSGYGGIPGPNGSAGGRGGGGAGRGATGAGFSGTANTGGGGGGGGHDGTDYNGGAGGSGVVILKYPNGYSINAGAGITASTVTVGSFKLTTFTAGTGTITFTT